MSTEERRERGNINTDVNDKFEQLINPKRNSIDLDNYILIWVDSSIRSNKRDDQNSFRKLCHVVNSIAMFTDIEKCQTFIDEYRTGKKNVFLIISGSLGRDFVPNINHISEIVWIYVFCQVISNHKSWAKTYTKVRVVSNNIDDVCKHLEFDTQKYQVNQIRNDEDVQLSSKQLSLPYRFHESAYLSENVYYYGQPKDYVQLSIASADIPFSPEENIPPINNLQAESQISSSQTVTPFYPSERQIEFSEEGSWPCIFVVTNPEDALINRLTSLIGNVQHSHSFEDCINHVNIHREDPHFVVLCGSTFIEHGYTLTSFVEKVYIYCPTEHMRQYSSEWSQASSNSVSILEDVDSLRRLILWDLSICIQNIGVSYERQNKQGLAYTRYCCAYRLHIIIQQDIQQRREMILAFEQ